MSEEEKEEVFVPDRLTSYYNEYYEATRARARWEAREKHFKEKILEFLYEDDDSKPRSIRAVSASSEVVFDVAVTPRRGIDIGYLRRVHPDIYAECEKISYAKSLKEPPHVPGREG